MTFPLPPIEFAAFLQEAHPNTLVEVHMPLCEGGVTWTDFLLRGAHETNYHLSFSSSPAGYQCHLGDSEVPFASFAGQVALWVFLRGLIPTMEHLIRQSTSPLFLESTP